jgi:hypothetical protein
LAGGDGLCPVGGIGMVGDHIADFDDPATLGYNISRRYIKNQYISKESYVSWLREFALLYLGFVETTTHVRI